MAWRLAGHPFSGGGGGGGGGGSGSVLAGFVYTATGAETTAGFTATFPDVGTTSFVAIATPMNPAASQMVFGTDETANTTTTADILPGANLTAGDKVLITLVGV